MSHFFGNVESLFDEQIFEKNTPISSYHFTTELQFGDWSFYILIKFSVRAEKKFFK